MNVKQKLHDVKLSEWSIRFHEQADSGLTVKSWCEKEGISVHAYNYWKHIMKEEYLSKALPDIVPVSLASGSGKNSMPASVPCSSLELHDSRDSYHSSSALPVHIIIGDSKIEIGSNTSDAVITRIIQAVRHA